jgi:hypothetical protein
MHSPGDVCGALLFCHDSNVHVHNAGTVSYTEVLVVWFELLNSVLIHFCFTFRCVHDDQRSFALGIQWIKVRLLGTIPAPLIFGRLIDESCVLWQDSCDGQGSCLMYDNKYMSRYERFKYFKKTK